MALEKITIATEEKQDKILQNIDIVSASVSQLAQKTVDTSNLADKSDINLISNLIIGLHSQFLLQIQTGNDTKKSNCKYLLIGVTTTDGSKVFDDLTATSISGTSIKHYNYRDYISDKTIKIGGKTFYLLKIALIVTEFDMWGSESALMLKL